MSSSSKLKNRRESWFVPPTGKRNSMPNRTDTCREEVGKRRRARSDGSEPKWGRVELPLLGSCRSVGMR